MEISAHEISNYQSENMSFFDSAPPRWLESLAVTKGLSNNIDLSLIRPHILNELSNNAHHALEIGFGYGRILNWLRTQTLTKRIIAVDHSKTNHQIVSSEFSTDPNTKLFHSNIADFQLNASIDLAIWMWAGIFELNQNDKLKSLMAISNQLIPTGKLIIEFPDEIIGHENILDLTEETLKVNTEFGSLNIYKCKTRDFVNIASKCNLSLKNEIAYKTESSIPRRILIFEKVVGV